MLCFEVWRNEEKLVTAGVSEASVLSFILTWVGREPNTSSVAATSAGTIPGASCRVGGIDGAAKHVDWYETEELKIGDELRVRLISSDTPDPPIRSTAVPRGQPNWNSRRVWQRRIRQILNRDWDPIGGCPEDEYDVYVGKIAAMIRDNATDDELLTYLERAEVEDIGLSPPFNLERGRKVVAALRVLGPPPPNAN